MGLGWLRPYLDVAQDVRTALEIGPRPRHVVHTHRIEKPILSVVIPCYNAARWLNSLLWSIQTQGIDDLQIIIVDDKSTDFSRRIIRAAARFDRRIEILDGTGQGPGVARNLGLKHVRGEFLTFADADDLVLPGAYKKMIATLQKTGSDFVAGAYVRHRHHWKNKPLITRRVHAEERLAQTASSFPEAFEEPVLWNKVFRTEFWQEFIGDMPEGLNYEDQPPIARAVAYAKSFDILTDEVYSWRLSDQGASRSGTKSTLRDIEDRLAITRLMWVIAEQANAPRDLKLNMLKTWMDRDVDMYIGYFSAKKTEDPYRRVLRDWAAQLVEWAEEFPDVWDALPAVSRLNVAALVWGNDATVLELLGTREEKGRMIPLDPECLKIDDRFPISSAELIDNGAPANIFEIKTGDLRLVVRALRAQWLEGELNVELALYVPGMPALQQQAVSLVLDNGSEVQPLSLGPVDSNELQNSLRDPWWDHEEGVFLAKVPQGLLSSQNAKITAQLSLGNLHVTSDVVVGEEFSDFVSSTPSRGRTWTLRSVPSIERQRLEIVQRTSAEEPATFNVRTGMKKSKEVSSAELKDLVSGDQGLRSLSNFSLQSLVGKPRRQKLQSKEGEADLQAFAGSGNSTLTNSEIRRNASGTWELQQHVRRVVADSAWMDDIDSVTSELVISGRFTGPAKFPPKLWLVSQANAVGATMKVLDDGKFEARFPAVQLQAKAYFLRWSAVPGNRFTRQPVGAGSIDSSILLEGAQRGVDLRFRQNGTTVVYTFPPREISQITRWGTHQLDPMTLNSPFIEGVYFESFEGKSLWDNPGAICSYVKSQGLGVPMYMGVRSPAQIASVPQGVTGVLVGSDEWYHILTSIRVIVSNNNLPYWFNKRDGQSWLQTWHGTPVKRLLFDAEPNFIGLGYRRLMARQASQWDLLLAQSEHAGDLLAGSANFTGPVHVGEYPRNSRTLDALKRAVDIKRQIGVPEGKKVILWAPTWRYGTQLTNFPAAQLAKEDDAVVLVRGHHMRAIGSKGKNVINVTSYPAIEDLYAISDLLISDYSSAFFDFEILGRPSVVFVPDLEQYKSEERGLYDNWPESSGRPIALDNCALCTSVSELLEKNSHSDDRLDIKYAEERVNQNLEWVYRWIIEALERR